MVFLNKKNIDVEICGWPSSGSTLTFQICQELGYKVTKTHGFRFNKNVNRYIYTIRDPRDIILSNAKRVSKDIWKTNKQLAIKTEFNRFVKGNYEDSLKDAIQYGNCIILKYEENIFQKEMDLIKFISLQFGNIPNITGINKIYNNTSLEENLKRSSKMPRFGKYDPVNLVHGDHITNSGKIGGWKSEMDKKNALEITKKFYKLLIEFGYDDTKIS